MPIDESLAFQPVRIAILVVSDGRTPTEEQAGDALAERIAAAGHIVADRYSERNERSAIVARLHAWIEDPQVDCVITTGGTGVTGRDVTPEALLEVQDKAIPGFGELFRHLSYQTIGTAAIRTRATACAARGTFLFALPGSPGAVRDAWDGIFATQFDSRFRPCNFVDLMPRLTGG